MLLRRLHNYISPLIVVVIIILTMMACSTDKFIPDGEYLLDKVNYILTIRM